MNTNLSNDNEFENDAESRIETEVSSEVESTPEESGAEENLIEENISTSETAVSPTSAEITTPIEDNEAAGEVKEVKTASAATSNNQGMSAMAKGLAVIAVILAIGAGLVFWKMKVGTHGESLNRVTAEDMQIILKDANPMQLKALAESPEQKKKISENIAQLLAVASQARKDGLADEPIVKQELENIRAVVTASIYDQEINKDKGPMPQFGYISEDQVKEFWNDTSHEAEFQKFIDSKLTLARESGKFPKDKELTEEELKQAKDDFAKIMIYAEEAKEKGRDLGEDFNREVELQVKLQQAQFLAGRYAQKVLADKVKVTDEDVAKYIAEHPEYDTKEKKAKAEQILSRAKAGEDFAKLANEFSQDPGNKSPSGELQGGIYKDVPKGQMMPAFEQAALALESGQIADNLVETPYGYHIIKLEKKGEGKDANGQPTQTYDVRHILITTTVKDPTNPMGREIPVTESVKAKLAEEKQKQVLDEIVANNPVEVAEDFTVPQPSQEDLQQMQQQMQQQMPSRMQPPPAGDIEPPNSQEPKKPQPRQ
ncbi:MAG: peptidylprolyl isomerase [Acidobacteria bacterium]|jgi:peptidyl-prolyl cis-trans isomerase C|nr:peptidylprolyl isomerase [Acidobacteriota bacterium]